jgi:cytidine deaminase
MEKIVLKSEVSVLQFSELDSSIQSLINKAKEQVKNSYAPYSGFHVGAAVLLSNGEIFEGNNQENAAYPSGLCAERVALFYANAQYPQVPVKAIAIAAYTHDDFVNEPVTPCGSCRQVILETEIRFENDIDIYLYGKDYIYHLANIRQLMPLSFIKSSLKG